MSEPTQRNSRKTLQGAAEIIAGIALGFVCIAAADTITTSPNLRLLIAIVAIVGVVLAEWGARHAIHKARTGNPSTRRQSADQSIQTPSRRSRRG